MFDSYLKGYHKICEDYVKTDINHAVLCDGCSSAKNTDVGARLLAHAYTYNGNLTRTLGNAYRASCELNLSDECLYSTLGILEKDDDFIRCILYGDGCIVVKTKNTFDIIKVVYDKAPYYPYYDYISTGRDSYVKAFGEPIVNYTLDTCTNTQNMNTVPFQPNFLYGYDLNTLEYILMFSDGVFFFQKDYREIINELVQFKSFQGEFLNRRLSALFKRQWKDHFVGDDFSCIGYYNDTTEGKE